MKNSKQFYYVLYLYKPWISVAISLTSSHCWSYELLFYYDHSVNTVWPSHCVRIKYFLYEHSDDQSSNCWFIHYFLSEWLGRRRIGIEFNVVTYWMLVRNISALPCTGSKNKWTRRCQVFSLLFILTSKWWRLWNVELTVENHLNITNCNH